MDAKLRMQMILLSEKMKQNKEIADKLGLKDCSHINISNKNSK